MPVSGPRSTRGLLFDSAREPGEPRFILQHQIDAASFLKDPLQGSLATLVAQIEEIVSELDQDKKDIDSTQALLTEAEAVYQAKALSGAQTAEEDPNIAAAMAAAAGTAANAKVADRLAALQHRK